MARRYTESSDLRITEDGDIRVTEDHVDSSRGLTAAMVTQATGTQLSPFLLVKLEFDSVDLNLWTGVGDLSWGGDTYIGVGDFLAVSRVDETSETEAQGLQLTLSGLPTTIVAVALDEDYQERPATIRLGCFDTSGAIVSDPEPIFVGRMDVMTLDDDGETATVSLTVEHRLIDLNRAYERNYTLEEHQELHAGDQFFEFVPAVQDIEVAWGHGVTA